MCVSVSTSWEVTEEKAGSQQVAQVRLSPLYQPVGRCQEKAGRPSEQVGLGESHWWCKSGTFLQVVANHHIISTNCSDLIQNNEMVDGRNSF